MNKKRKITAPDVLSAKRILAEYKRQKGALEKRYILEDKLWSNVYTPGGSSSWIFNSIINKHADIVEKMPTSVCLPREKRDEEAADTLTRIIPAITERAHFEQSYSDNAWEKLKHGTCAYGVFWNTSLEDGLGDIDVRALRISDIFWDMSVSDIQDSKNLFIVSVHDVASVEASYPHFDFESNREAELEIAASLGFSESFDSKCVVVDWYYKRYLQGGACELHLCKFCGDTVLYSSECDESISGGWYAHGRYPIVFDRLYPMGNGVCGFGMIAIASDAQDYINKIDSNMLTYADWASRVRFWAKRSLGVNEKEFLDLNRSIVEVEGDIDQEKLRQIEISPINDSVIDSKRMKIEELKEITGSRDVSQGGITGGVTAAAAISVLREAGAKSSRDGIEESYRAYEEIVSLIIELISEFYSTERVFRISGKDGTLSYVGISGRALTAESEGIRPHFDIKVEAKENSPTMKKERNELIRALYEDGAFKAENVKETLIMLELMDFDGVSRLRSALSREYAPSPAV
ncbi:MAG: hypothetical protein IKJ24_05300 [Clostridia bacterium]|nr:hypothetical protein [Clostridia bacterium]